MGKVSFIYQVTDSRMVTNQSQLLYRLHFFSLSFFWQSKISVIRTRIVVSVFTRLYLISSWIGLHWYDGPGICSNSIVQHDMLWVSMSTFQTFVETYVNGINIRSWQPNYYRYEGFKIEYQCLIIDVNVTAIPDKGKVILPPCTKEFIPRPAYYEQRTW